MIKTEFTNDKGDIFTHEGETGLTIAMKRKDVAMVGDTVVGDAETMIEYSFGSVEEMVVMFIDLLKFLESIAPDKSLVDFVVGKFLSDTGRVKDGKVHLVHVAKKENNDEE